MMRIDVALAELPESVPTGAEFAAVDENEKLATAISRDATLSEIADTEPGWSIGPPLVVLLGRSLAVLNANALPVAIKARAAITITRLRPPASRLYEADKSVLLKCLADSVGRFAGF